MACKEQELIEEAMSLHFLMSHIFLNRAQTQEEFKQFNDEVDKEASPLYASWAKKQNLFIPQASSHTKKKIALIKDRIVENSPSKVEFSLLSALSNDETFCQNHEIVVYSMATIEKSLDDARLILEIKKLGFDVSEVALHSLDLQSNFQSHLKRALAIRDDMQKRGTETMIVANNSTPIATFLFASRSAIKQIFWSHGNFEYDVLGIDKRISHCLEPANKTQEYSFFSVPQLSKFNHVSYPKEVISRERFKFPRDKIILGMIGRLVKMDNDEYLQTVIEVMQANPKTIFLACGTGNMETIKHKIHAKGFLDRFFFPGFVDPHLYGSVIDIWLDTFPMPGGQSVLEFMSKGKPLLYLVNLNQLDIAQKEAHQKSVDQGAARFFALSIEDYKMLANRIIQDQKYRKDIEKTVQKAYKEWCQFDLSSFYNLLK